MSLEKPKVPENPILRREEFITALEARLHQEGVKGGIDVERNIAQGVVQKLRGDPNYTLEDASRELEGTIFRRQDYH